MSSTIVALGNSFHVSVSFDATQIVLVTSRNYRPKRVVITSERISFNDCMRIIAELLFLLLPRVPLGVLVPRPGGGTSARANQLVLVVANKTDSWWEYHLRYFNDPIKSLIGSTGPSISLKITSYYIVFSIDVLYRKLFSR